MLAHDNVCAADVNTCKQTTAEGDAALRKAPLKMARHVLQVIQQAQCSFCMLAQARPLKHLTAAYTLLHQTSPAASLQPSHRAAQHTQARSTQPPS